MTHNRRPFNALPGAITAVAGLLLIMLSLFARRIGLADPAGNISPAQVAALLAGAALIAAGAILAFRPAGDPRPPLPYIAGTALSGLDAVGELVGDPRAALWLMVPLLLLAAFLRLYHLTFQSFWLDELMTWWRSSYNDLPTVIRSVESDVWPPGYSLWAWLLIHTLGASEFILRFPAALAGVLSVASVYALGRRLGGHLAGLFGAALISVLEISIYYSQEARPYAGLILFSTLSTYFWLRIVQGLRQGQGGLRWVIAGYIVTALLAMYWNYYGLVLVACQGLGMALWLVTRPKTWPWIGGIYAAIAAGYAPWIPGTLADLGRDVYLSVRPGGFIDELMAFFRVLFNLEQTYVLAGIAVVAAALAVDLVRARQGKHARWSVWLMLLGWLLIPFTLTYVRSLISVSTFYHRYLLISLPAAVLLIGLGLSKLPIRRWMQAGLMLVAVVVLLNNLARHWDYYTRPTKAEFRQAVEQVASRDASLGGPSLIVGFTGFHGTLDLFDFYFAHAGSARQAQLEAGFGDETPAVRQKVTQTGAKFIWLVAAQNRPGDDFLNAMSQQFTLLDHKELTGADVWLYQVK